MEIHTCKCPACGATKELKKGEDCQAQKCDTCGIEMTCTTCGE